MKISIKIEISSLSVDRALSQARKTSGVKTAIVLTLGILAGFGVWIDSRLGYALLGVSLLIAYGVFDRNAQRSAPQPEKISTRIRAAMRRMCSLIHVY